MERGSQSEARPSNPWQRPLLCPSSISLHLGAVIPRKRHSAGRLPPLCRLVSNVVEDVAPLVLVRRQFLIPVLHARHRCRRLVPSRDRLRAESGRRPERKTIRHYPILGSGTFSALEASP